MKTGYQRVSRIQDLLRSAGQLSPKTVVADVEPLVAFWDTSRETLDRGLDAVLHQLDAIPGLEVVCFATNSDRCPSTIPKTAGLRVMYLSSARKPIRTGPYQDLPRPGIVVGDQVATDGVLAHRLGYTFLHYTPQLAGVPRGPRLLQRSGELAVPFLFRA
jgi:predicted HAD superfamily phosphohydrolase YqeG